MSYLLYLGIVLFSVTQSAATKLFHKGGGSQLVFNAIKGGSAFLLMLLISFFHFSFHLPTLGVGVAYGALLALSMYAGYEALRRGPMALTSMLVSFSVLIPFLWGVAVRGERLAAHQYVAVALLLAALLATNADQLKRREESRTSYGMWLFFVGLTFVANGVSSVLQSEHQTRFPGEYQRELTLYAMGVCALVYTLLLFVKEPLHKTRQTKGKGVAALAGIANALVGFLTVWLASFENASVLFPVVSAGTALGVLLCGRFLFRERLKRNHYAALLLGVTAVILFKLPV